MNKILNWTFGACFRTLGRFLAIFIVFILLLFVGSKLDFELPSWLGLRVKADTYYTFTTSDNTNINQTEIDLLNSASYTASGLILPSRIEFSDCNGDTYCPTSISKTVYTGGTVARGITTATNGFAVSHDLLTSYAKDTLYSYTSYMCLSAPGIATSRQKLYLDSGLGATATGKWNNPADLYFTNYRFSFSYKWTHYGISGGWSQSDMQCYQWNYIFKSNVDSNTITNRYWFSPMENINYNFVGYTIEPLGYVGDLDEQDIINIINNSGLATANSVNQVNQSVNQVKQEVQELNNSIDETNNTLKDDNTTGAENSASGFFNDFTTETFGLTSIITAPLNAINSLINSSCSNLVLPLPYVEENLTLPCMTSIYSNYFKGFFDLYQIITTGLISYYIIVRIFNLVKDFKNPEHDEIEVMDL